MNSIAQPRRASTPRPAAGVSTPARVLPATVVRRLRLVTSALALLASRCHDPSLRLSDVAVALRLSRCYVSRLIRAETGRPFRQHVAALRLRGAVTQLDDNRLSIKEVAVAAGYSSTASFDHEFRRAFDCAPSEWRRRRWRNDRLEADAEPRTASITSEAALHLGTLKPDRSVGPREAIDGSSQ